MNLYHRSPWMTVLLADASASGGKGQKADMRIDGPVGRYDYGADTWQEARRTLKQAVRKELDRLSAMEVDEIDVEINSLGGSFQHALAIHDYLAQFRGKVTTRVIGFTASAATIIAQAGDRRLMSDNAQYLIHRASNGVGGNANEIRALADTLEQFDERMANIYAKRSGRSIDDVMAVMNEANGNGRWMSPTRVLELGLVDEIYEPMDAAACAVLPEPDAIAAAHLPPLPGTPDKGPETLSPAGTEQTPQPNVSTVKTSLRQSETGDSEATMKLNPDQIKALKERFGDAVALSAVTEDLDYAAALDRGAQAQAEALTEVRQQLGDVTAERDTLKTERDGLAKQLKDARAGLRDPLQPNDAVDGDPSDDAQAKTAQAKADAEAEAKADREKLDSLVAAANSVN